MEAPGFLGKKLWVVAGLILLGCSVPRTVFEYEISAHAALTAAIIDAYNKNHPVTPIANEYRFAAIRGSKEEDAGTRPLFHFYDPTNGKGLTWGTKRWLSVKKWASRKTAQGLNDFTWEAGLDAYAQGDDARAFLILGHVLHLLEDMGVPEHTRNDPHPTHSPYEHFTKTRAPVVDGKPAIVLGSLGEYFDALAKYSNENFYSADSINNAKYSQPKPDYFNTEGSYEYAFKSVDGEQYRLARIIDDRFNFLNSTGVKKLSIEENSGEKKILSDYWRLISAKTVRYGVGLTQLFISEGEKLRQGEAVKATTRQRVTAKGTLASIVEAFGFGGDGSGDGLIEDEDVPVDTSGDARQPVISGTKAAAAKKSTAKKKTANAGDESAKPGTDEVPNKEPAVPVKVCAYGASGAPAAGTVVINEVAWMGSRTSASDEWVELKNIGTSSVDISGWQLVSKRGRIHATIPAGEKIPEGGFYLFERTNDGTVPGVAADVIYQGALSNSDDGLRLFDGVCKLVNSIEASPAWLAGNAAGRRTMERGTDGSWHDYSGNSTNGIFGTPRKKNSSVPAIIIPPSKLPSSGGSSPASPAASAQSSSPTSSATQATAQEPAPGDVVINEFLFDAQGLDANQEFIELYNTTDRQIDLSGWSVQTQSAKKNFEDGNVIAAKGCFLIGLGSAFSPTPSLRWASGSLNNTAGTIYITKNQEYVTGDADADIIDRAAYTSTIVGFAPGKSIARGTGGALHVQNVPTSGDCAQQVAQAAAQSPSLALSSSPAAPSGDFLKSVYVYSTGNGDGSVIDLAWEKYPFIPGSTERWKVLVFYLNSEPGTRSSIGTDDDWAPPDRSNVIKITYPIYCGGCLLIRPSLILPDTQEGSGTGGGLSNFAHNYRVFSEDNRVRLSAGPMKKGDYVTIGYYDFSHSGGGNQSFFLVKADPKRYYFDDPRPTFAPPVITKPITTAFNPANGTLAVTLPSATDPDSPDIALTYQFFINGKVANSVYTLSGTHIFLVSFGDDFEITYFATDEFNIRSVPAEAQWSYPGAVTWLVEQDKSDGTAPTIGERSASCSLCAPSVGYQSFSPSGDVSVDAIVVRLASGTGTIGAVVKLRVLLDSGGAPSDQVIAEKTVDFLGVPADRNRDSTFLFDAPFSLDASKRYWLELGATYANSNDAYSPYLRPVNFSGSDAYPNGGSAVRRYENFDAASGDWYFKIGKRE